MIEVEVNGIVHEFPEGTSKDVIRGALSKKYPKSEKKPSLAKTVFDQGMQGATFGFADEVTDRIGAGIASLVTGQSYGDLLGIARQGTQKELQNQLEQRPVLSIASNLIGGLATGGALSTTKTAANLANAGTKTGNFLRLGNTGTNVVKGAAAGSASGAVYGAGTAKEGERLDAAREGAVIGGVGGAFVPVAGATLSRINRALGKKSPVLNSEQIRKQASKLYNKADETGGVLKADFVDDFLLKAERDLLSDDEIIRNMRSNKPLMEAFDDLSAFKGQPMSLQRAQALDEQLGDMISANMDMGRPNKVGKSLIDVQSNLRNMIDDVDQNLIEGGKEGFEALKEARKLWSTSRKLADIERIIQRAELMDNPATGIKTGFRTLLNNPKRLKGYSKVERKAIKKAAQSGVVTDSLRILGSRLIPIASISTGGGLGSTAASMAGSAASRGAASKMQVRKAANLAEIVASHGKGREVRPLISLSTNAQEAIQGNPLLSLIANQ